MDIKTKLSTLKSQKQFLLATYRDCYNYVNPLLGTGYTNYGNLNTQDMAVSTANLYKANKYDSTATDGTKILASFIFSNICPSNVRWFDFEIASEPNKRSDWLDQAANIVWREIHGGNFNSSGFECILHLVIGGQGILFEEYRNNGLHFELWDPSTCYFDSTVKGGAVDCVLREYTLTKQQAMKEFPDCKADCVVNASDSANIQFIQAIYPRQKGEYGGVAETKPFASVHILQQTGEEVRVSGYDEFPLGIPRWVVIPNSAYAFGPVYEALDDIKTLNIMTQFILQNAEMAICGMYGAVDDGVINTGSIQVGPRKVIIMAERDNMWSLNSGGDFSIADQMQSAQREQVRRSLMVDQLQMPYQQGTTATEVNVRTDLLRQITGPVFGRLEEFLQAIIVRSFGLLLRNNRLPELPEELQELPDLNIRYVSPLARAQRNIEVQVIESYEISLGNTAAVNPDVLDVYDWDAGAIEKARLKGVPEALMNDDAKIRRIREQKAQAAKAQQEQALQQEIILQQAKKGAPAV